MALHLDTTPGNELSELDGLTLANVDLGDAALIARLSKRDRLAAGERIREAVRHMQELGVIDVDGNRLNKELPADMREDSSTDFGG